MIIFPLQHWQARVVLILIAAFIGLIWSMLMWPAFWRRIMKHFAKKEDSKVVEEEKTRQMKKPKELRNEWNLK